MLLAVTSMQGQLKYTNADENFERLHFARAAKQYERLIKRKGESQKVLQRAGDSYYFNSDMENAIRWYEVLHKKYKETIDVKYTFRYIHALKGSGKKEQAKKVMKEYSASIEGSGLADNVFNEKAWNNLIELTSPVQVTNLSTNTPEADFGPAFYKDHIVFSSAQDTSSIETRVYQWNEQPYLDLYMASVSNGGNDLENAVPFSETLNTKYHEAAIAFNATGDVAYFTRNNYTEKSLGRDEQGTSNLKIYRSRMRNNVWSEPKEVPFNNVAYSVGQPALSPDGKYLYFVSDMPGSLGETDIYRVAILGNNRFSEPENLGEEINTSGREMFPFVVRENIYFASDGHVGLGGFDIFESDIKLRGGYTKPRNLGKPYNSNRDDFAYILNERKKTGYFSSNRPGGKGDDDIYSFRPLTHEESCTQTIQGTVLQNTNSEPTAGVEVKLTDNQGNFIGKAETDRNGIFNIDIPIQCGERYGLSLSKPGYLNGKTNFKTVKDYSGVTQLTTQINKKLDKLIVREKGTLKIKVNKIYFDVDNEAITAQARVELDKIVAIMNDYPKMVIKIESHTDSRGSDSYNEELSGKRAKATGTYIISQGISPSRIESAIGYGEKKLLNACENGVECSDEAHDVNRRSEFIIVSMD